MNINIHIDINMNIDVHILININNLLGVGDHFRVPNVLEGTCTGKMFTSENTI